MRYITIILILFVVPGGFDAIAQSPDITQLEYYFDTDPGFGNGVAVAVTTDPVASTTFDMDISGLAPGFHKAYFRTIDDNGAWSLCYFRNVFILDETTAGTPTDIVAMEYFFDTDPGFGNGVAVAVTTDTVTSTAFDMDVSALDEGFHKVYFRTKEETGKWGLSVIKTIFKIVDGASVDSPDIVAMEYFIDADPGFGNGNVVTFIGDSIIDMTFDVDISGASIGVHDLYVRIKVENGSWSLINISNFKVSEVELTAFLEGPYNGSDMNTSLNSDGRLPLNQPFNVAPWNYAGTESVVSIPNANIVDWVLLETRNADDAASATAATISSRYAAFILDDGTIVDLDGTTSNLKFNTHSDTNNYVVIYHRNHLGILSAEELEYSVGTYSYDFTTGAAQVHGGMSGHAHLGAGVYGMAGGDANADGSVDAADKAVWLAKSGKAGYLPEDMNLNGQVNNPDKNDVWILNNNNKTSQVPE